MTRILAGLLLAAIALVAILWWRMDLATSRAAALDVALSTAVSANEASQAAINTLAAEMLTNDREAVEALRRERSAKANERAATTELERLKRDNQDLRAYLDSPIPGAITGWLWLDVQAGDGDRDTGGVRLPAGDPAAGHAEAAYPPVSHQAGWTWAMLTDSALDSCIDDKAALRSWVDNHKKKIAEAR